jgi:hypothetical protein
LEEFLDCIEGKAVDFIGAFMQILNRDRANLETIVD